MHPPNLRLSEDGVTGQGTLPLPPPQKSRQDRCSVPNPQGIGDKMCSKRLEGPEMRLERLTTGPESQGP